MSIITNYNKLQAIYYKIFRKATEKLQIKNPAIKPGYRFPDGRKMIFS